jgi:hypothetical protein
MYIYIYVYIYIYMYIYIYIYTYIYIHIYRAKLQNAVVDSSVVNITGFKPNSSSGNKGNRIAEILSEQADISIIGKDVYH